MISESMIPEFDHEMAVTRKVLECLPDEHLAWKPHEKSFSMGELARHIVEVPSWMGVTIDQDVLDMAGGFDQPKLGTRDEMLSIFDEKVAEARGKLAGASDETLMGTWTLKTGDVEHLAMPRVAVVRGFILNHMIHHRGQLTVYLRLKDVPLPQVYGPSADDASF